MRFGLATDSHITGAETARPDRVPTAAAVERRLRGCVASISRSRRCFPPRRSAERAYAKARRDEDVVLTPVPVRDTPIYSNSPEHRSHRHHVLSGVLCSELAARESASNGAGLESRWRNGGANRSGGRARACAARRGR